MKEIMNKQKELEQINNSAHPIDREFSRIPVAVLVATTIADIRSNPSKYEVVTKVIYSEEELKRELGTKLHNYVTIYNIDPENSNFHTPGELVGIRNTYREEYQRKLYEELKQKFEPNE